MNKITINFTKASLASLPLPSEGKRATYHDSKTRGLQIRVTSSGVKTFSVFRWVSVDNKPERITLGRFPDMSVEKAREKAEVINAAIAEKKNPNDLIREKKAEITLNELFDIYMERWSKPRKRTWEEDIEKFERHFKKRTNLANRKLSAITKADLAQLHARIGKTHPITANRILALVSSMFGRAAEWGIWSKENPARGIRKFPETSRDRFIQSDEMPFFFESLALEPNQTLQDYFMLLLLTGVRRSNLMSMRWNEINLQRQEWRIPKTKNGLPQVISLADSQGVIMRILEARKAKLSAEQDKIKPWVFPGAGSTGHIVEPRKGWERILVRAEALKILSLIAEKEGWKPEKLQKAKIETWAGEKKMLQRIRENATALKIDTSSIHFRDLRIHDLRRTLGSWMAGTGATTAIIGRQLNHKSPAATAVYARLQLDPVNEARNKALAAMFNAGGLTEPAEVIKMRTA